VDSRGASAHHERSYRKLAGELRLKRVSFKIIKARKGISQILAVLFLIVIAITAIALTCDWIMASGGFTAADAGKQIHAQMLALLVCAAP
jgi:hypothetical protein